MEDINTKYNQDIEDFFNNKFKGNSINFGVPGDLLAKYLKSVNPIVIGTGTLSMKIDLHDLKKDDLLNLPKLINNPLLILEYPGIRYGITIYVEIIKYNKNGLLLVGLFDDSKILNKIEIIEVASIYGKRIEQIINSIEKGNLLYADKQKIEKFFSDSGLNSLKCEKLLEKIVDSYKSPALFDRLPGEGVSVLPSIEHDKDTTKKSDSDIINKKNNSEELGAVEVLEQNTKTDYSNYRPTYKILSSYDHLFDDAGCDFPAEKGGLEATLMKIKEVISKYNFQAYKIAKHLKASTLEQSAFNIWHFCVSNIAYKLDRDGYEELRTPNRTWKDRFTGVDCDDFAIFCSCILLQMGYMPHLAVVAFNNNAQFGHIYTVLNSKLKTAPYNLGEHDGGAISGGVVIDPVLRTIFNKHPKGITKAKIMNIQVLNGIEEGTLIKGFGGILPADATTQKLINHYNKLMVLKKSGHKMPNINRELHKLSFMIKMNGNPERNLYLEVMPLIYDIDKYGQFIFISEEAAQEVVNFLDKTVGQGLTEYELVYENGKAVPVLKGLGEAQLGELAAIKDLFKKVKDKVKSTVKKVKETAKKTAKGVKAAATKVKDAVVRYNPITIASRNGLLLAISYNFRNIARRYYLAFASASELQAAGYTTADQAKLKISYTKAEKLFEKMGGKKENLIATIKKGKDKKPLFGNPKKLNGIEGLGDPVTLAAITAALAPILAFVKFLKESGVSFKKNEEDPTPESEDNISVEEEQAFLKSLNEGTATDDNDEDEDDGEGNDNTLLYVGGAVALGILGIIAFKKK